jgi:antitoxin VapB
VINLSSETIALAQRLAAAHGVSTEDAIKQAIEQSAREAGVMAPELRRELSAAAIAARKARIDRIVDEIAAMPILDPRSPREIMDGLNAL